MYNKKYFLLFVLAFLAVFYVFVVLYSSFFIRHNKEGFENENGERYVLKQNQDIYDNFYAEIYDKITSPNHHKEEIDNLIQYTNEKSVILNVGIGNDEIITELNKHGLKEVFGIDKSKAMVKHSKNKQHITRADPLDRLTFDANTFSHILCIHLTLYEITDRPVFFSNCAYWLKNGGFLVVHIVNTTQKNTEPIIIKQPAVILNGGGDGDDGGDGEKGELEYIKMTTLDTNKKPPQMVVRETFKNRENGVIRENELSLSLINSKQIIKEAKHFGFVVKEKIKIKPKIETTEEYLFFFQKD